jgi:hypothetical protein
VITFYATVRYGGFYQTPQNWGCMPNVAYLLPASSWARGGVPLPPVKIPPHIHHVAADSGGFVATKIWGDYRYNLTQYANWLSTFNPDWAAMMDYCCEPEITGQNDGIIRQRQDRTTANAWEAWWRYQDVEWAWVPTIQGWNVQDYIHHANELKPLIYAMRRHYRQIGNPYFRVGIGTLCNRANSEMIQQVVKAVRWTLGDVPLHLWGVKLKAVHPKLAAQGVVSVDSAAYDPGGFGRDGIAARDEQRAMGMKQREWVFSIALPRYIQKFESRLSVA